MSEFDKRFFANNTFWKAAYENQKRAYEEAMRNNSPMDNLRLEDLPFSYKSNRFGGYDFLINRINVFLGANGSGKSSLLNEIKSTIVNQKKHKLIYIEGGRAIQLDNSIEIDAKNFKAYEKLDVAIKRHETQKASNFVGRIKESLILLDKKEQHIKGLHSDAVKAWMDSDRSGDCPDREEPPLESLFRIFSDIFPEIALSFNANDKSLWVQKGGSRYRPSQMSDGEKQVFSMLADFINADAEHRFVLVDEPELNLHPELAIRLWSRIEEEFPEKVFIYATHCISFSLRKNIGSVYVINPDPEKIAFLDGISSLQKSDASSFLGALPGIMSCDKVLVVEGDDDSFDSDFYRWLLSDFDLEVYPAGGCLDVVSVVSKQGVWGRIGSSIQMVGVIDSDYRSDEYLAGFSDGKCLVLSFHEIESYLCLPELVKTLADHLGVVNNLDIDDVKSAILDVLEEKKLSVAARRYFSRARFDFGISLSRKDIAGATSIEELSAVIAESVQGDVDAVICIKDAGAVRQQMQVELSRIQDVLDQRKYEEALRLVGGKEVLSVVYKMAGFYKPAHMLKVLCNKFKPQDFGDIDLLRSSLLERLVD